MFHDQRVYTIGHSSHPIDVFLDLLCKHEISAIADVRSSPFSRFCPQFNQPALVKSLRDSGICYAFLGRELGGHSDDPSCYVNGRIQYARLAERQEFHQGIDRLNSGADKYRIALMCSEQDPLDCHRTLLVSRVLDSVGLKIQHIHTDGYLEHHCDAMERLLDIVGLPQSDLVHSNEELMAEAVLRQEKRIAFTDERFVDNDGSSLR